MMSKSVSLSMAVILLAALISAMVAAAPPEENLALHRPYRCSVPIMTGWTGLTDGDHDSDSAPECFATANVDTYPKYVTIDLGAVCTIQRVVVHNSSNGNTRQVSLERSVDGQNYQSLRQGFIFPDRTAQVLSHQFEARQARYVRVTFHDSYGKGLGGDHTMFLREVEIFGVTSGDRPQDTENPLAAYLGQSPDMTSTGLSIFRRYCLMGPTTSLHMAVLGDSFAAGEAEEHWAQRLADRLQEQYDKPVQRQSAAVAGFSTADCRRFMEQTGDDAPDIIVLAMGYDAAIARLPISEFRSSVEQMIRILGGDSGALLVLVTPMPLNHDPKMKGHDVVAQTDTRPYAWQMELLAQQHTLPLMRTGAALTAAHPGPGELYADNLSLSGQGHQALADALGRLLSGL